MFWVRHESDHIAALICDSGDVSVTAIGINVNIGRNHSTFGEKLIEGFFVGDKTTLAVLEWNDDFLTNRIVASPDGVIGFNAQFLVAANKVPVVIACQRTWE